jgi:hypothetical protein
MPMGRPKAELVLSEDERSQLSSIARSRAGVVFLPGIEYILVGMTAVMICYVIRNFRYC